MPEQPKDTLLTLDKGMGELVDARAALMERPKDEAEEASSIQAALRTMRRFYEAFFREVFGVEVNGFGWEAKRVAVDAIVAREDAENGHLEESRLAVGFLFEDICDVLHGEVDFGYTDDIDVLRAFGQGYLDTWAALVFDWLDNLKVPEAAELRHRYEQEPQS